MGVETFRNSFDGERAFVVGNGPSLEEAPLDKLMSEYTFATTKINNIYRDTRWRPTFYSYTRSPPPKEELYDCCRENIDMGVTCFISGDNREYFGESDNVFYVDRTTISENRSEILGKDDIYTYSEDKKKKWSDDITSIVYHFNCSLYPIYQIINYMGFEKIYLLGCDLGIDKDGYLVFDTAPDPLAYLCEKYERWSPEINIETNALGYDLATFVTTTDKPVRSMVNTTSFLLWYQLWKRSYEGSTVAGRIAERLYSHPDAHFDTEYDGIFLGYYQKGEDDSHRRAHELARRKLRGRGVEVYNATLGGELEVFPRVDLEAIL